MSLQDRIRQFSEQTRAYLLEEFARSLEEDTTVVKWEGFNEDGKLTVKDKDLLPTVDGLGQKYASKGSKLILDKAGSVEQRKSRRKQPVQITERAEQIPEAKIVPRSNIIIFEDVPAEEGEVIQTMPLGIYIVYYRQEIGNEYTYIAGDSNLDSVIPVDRSQTIFLDDNIAGIDEQYVKEVIIVGAAAAAVSTGTPLDGTENGGPSADPGPHTTYTTMGAPFNLSVSTTSSTGQHARYGNAVSHVFSRRTDLPISIECDLLQHTEHQNDYRLYGYSGVNRVQYDMYYIAIEKYIYYLQSNPVNNQDQYITIDLAKYIPHSIIESHLVHSYTTNIKVDNYTEQSVSFLIFEVYTVDFDQSYSEDTQYTNSYGDTVTSFETVWRGEKKRYVLHMKINLTTGAIEHRKQEALINKDGEEFSETANLLYTRQGVEYFVRMFARASYGGATTNKVIHSFYRRVSVNYFFANAYEGDWLYEFRNLVVDETDYLYGYNEYNTVLEFLQMHFYDGAWYGYINGATFPGFYTDVYEKTWSNNQTGLGAGQANNNDYTDIQGVDALLTGYPDNSYYYLTYFTEARVGAGNTLIQFRNRYVPDFNYQVSTPYWRINFSYVQPAKHDVVGINSYSATLTTIYISTGLLTSARAGYSVIISGTNLIDGTYTVSNIDEGSLVVELTNPTSNPISPATETELSGTLSRQ